MSETKTESVSVKPTPNYAVLENGKKRVMLGFFPLKIKESLEKGETVALPLCEFYGYLTECALTIAETAFKEKNKELIKRVETLEEFFKSVVEPTHKALESGHTQAQTEKEKKIQEDMRKYKQLESDRKLNESLGVFQAPINETEPEKMSRLRRLILKPDTEIVEK